MMRKALQKAILTALTLGLVAAPAANTRAAIAANTQFYNFGTLDIRPVQSQNAAGAINADWFIEYLKPGEQKQEMIQISNFSAQPKTLTIYSADTIKNEGKNFFTNSYEKPINDISKWITLPTENIILKSGESKIFSVNFKLPKTAGIGMHTGAIIVRETHGQESSADFNNISIEKGVRIYLNVVGPIITTATPLNITSTVSSGTYSLNVQTLNPGTTDFTSAYNLQLKDVYGISHATANSTIKITPQSNQIETLSIQKPAYGLFNLYLNDEYIKTVLFIPFWIPLALIALAFAFVPVMKRNTILLHIPKLSFTYLKNAFAGPQTRAAFAYLGLFAITASLFINSMNIEKENIKAQILPASAKEEVLKDILPKNKGATERKLTSIEKSASSYELTIKWGAFRKVLLPSEKTKEWHGRIYFPNARIKTSNLLHFERNDQAEIVGNKTALRFSTLTGPDNDGITIYVQPNSEEIPIVKYENYDTGESFEFLITDYINSAGVYPNQYYATYFKTEYGIQDKLKMKAVEKSKLDELVATGEIQATPTAATQIPELKNLLEELPATPDALSDFIFQSDYVEKITEEDGTHKVKTDSILLKALEATPDVLAEISATPELNFLFIPSETINFPAQEFSFDQDKESAQDLGTMIFVQNKTTPWNTYIGTTDFQLLSGNSTIPASALNINPGQSTLLRPDGKTRITEGQNHQITSEDDRTTLVNVEALTSTPSPNINEEDITADSELFILKPKLTITIPKGTRAGTYRGQLVITNL